MQKINKIFIIVFLVVFTSCQTSPQQDTAVLSGQTQTIVDLFLKENEKWLGGDKQLIIEGNIKEEQSCLYLNLYYNDSSIYKPYGKYNGIVHYKGYEILLYGDSWNDFFWTSGTIYEIPNTNNAEVLWLYDPIEWDICIRLKDTTLNMDDSNFPDILSRHTICLMDSIEKIIRSYK